MLSIGELAARSGARIAATLAALPVEALALPGTAGVNDLTLELDGVIAARLVDDSPAVAVLCRGPRRDGRAFEVDDVLAACARLVAWLPVRRLRGIAPPGGAVHGTARIGPGASIASDADIGERSEIGAGAVIGAGVRIGAWCRIGPGSVIDGGATLGNRVSVGAGCAIGGDGFAFVRDGGRWLRVPVFGSVTIDDDSVLLDHVVVHAGVFGDTAIARGCALDSHVLIGHDSRVGRDSALAGQVALAGAARIGRGCRIGGKVGIGEGVRIADGVTVTAMSMVSRSLNEPGASYSAAWPAERSGDWWRRVARWRRRFGRDVAAPS